MFGVTDPNYFQIEVYRENTNNLFSSEYSNQPDKYTMSIITFGRGPYINIGKKVRVHTHASMHTHHRSDQTPVLSKHTCKQFLLE